MEFLITLLRGFQVWRDASSDFQSAYMALKSQGVTFPPEEVEVRPRASGPSSAVTLSRSLRAVLDLRTPSAAVAEGIAAQLKPLLDSLYVRIQANIDSPDLPDYIAELEEIEGALDAFQRFTESRRLVKPEETEGPKVKTDSELLMMASFNWTRLKEPMPLCLPGSDQCSQSNGQFLAIPDQEAAERRPPEQLEELVVARQGEMQQAEQLRLENEALKKEVETLRLRVRELQASKDPASAETARHTRRSPLQSSFATLSPGHTVDLLSFDSPMRSTLTLKSTTSPSSPSITAQEEPLEVVNEKWYVESCQWSSGLLYKGEDLEVLAKVEVERQRGRVKLCFRNVSPSFLKDLCLFPVSQETVIREEMQEQPPSLLPPSSQYCCELEIRPTRPYTLSPVLAVSYSRLSAKVKFALRLPVPISKFIEPCSSPFAEVSNLLLGLKQAEKVAEFRGLKEGITNMKTLARVFCLNNALALYFPSETGLERGVVGCGSGFGTLVGAQVQLDPTASNVRIATCCSDPVLRSELLQLLVSQIRL